MKIFNLVFPIFLLMTSCHTTRKVVQPEQIKVVAKDTVVVKIPEGPSRADSLAADSVRKVKAAYARIDSNRIRFETFSAKVKVDYKDSKDKNLDFNAFIRMRKDSVVWVSVIAALGVEAFRVLIRPDSVVIMDKLEKTVKYTTVADLQRITQLPFDFTTLQQLIAGNPLYMDGALQTFREDVGMVSMFMEGDRFRHLASFVLPGLTLTRSQLDDVDLLRKRTAHLEYEEYAQIFGRSFPGIRKIRLSDQQTVNLRLEFRQVEFDTPQSYPFSIPRNYTLK
jgi:Domain of unknown function (DUF4292)